MKLYLNSNIAEGTPEELVTYKELLKERGLDSEKSLFHFGHMHQPTEEEVQDTFKGFFGSLKLDNSSIGSEEGFTEEADEQEVDNSVYDKGAFYTVTDEAEDSALPVGAILQHQHGRIFSDSKGQQCIISRPSFVDRGHANGDEIKQDRFELAKQLGIQLTTTTDFAVEAKGKYFKVTEDYSYFNVGDIVTIDEDDKDNQPLCKDEYGYSMYMYLHHLELLEDDEEKPTSTDIKVGDRVKVLDSKHGAEGEATVTKVLENGDVELAGTNKRGRYLTNWSNHVSNLEKIEAEEDAPMGYTFWYIDGVVPNHLHVLKASLYDYFEDSKGTRYPYKDVHGLVKPIDNAYVREEFEDAKHNSKLLKYYPTLDEFAWEK